MMDRPKASVMICSDLASHLESKNLSLIEAFDALSSPGFPAKASFYAVAKVWGLPEGRTHSLVLRVKTHEGAELVRAGEHQITPGGAVKVHTAISRFLGVSFPTPGLYEVEALYDNTVIGVIPIQLNQVTGS